MREGVGGDRLYHRAPPCPRTPLGQNASRQGGHPGVQTAKAQISRPISQYRRSCRRTERRWAFACGVQRGSQPPSPHLSATATPTGEAAGAMHVPPIYVWLSGSRQEEMVRGGEGSDRRLVFGSSHRREGGRGRNGGSHLSLPLAHPISFGLLYSSRGVET